MTPQQEQQMDEAVESIDLKMAARKGKMEYLMNRIAELQRKFNYEQDEYRKLGNERQKAQNFELQMQEGEVKA